jgi:hypothetical protein
MSEKRQSPVDRRSVLGLIGTVTSGFGIAAATGTLNAKSPHI